MHTKLIDGKEIARKKRKELEKRVIQLKGMGIYPRLAVILVGDDSASMTYVRNKQKACEEIGIESDVYHYEAETDEETILQKVEQLNQNPSVHGILVQLPLPKHIDSKKVILAIDPNKDVDGFHPINIGKRVLGERSLVPCTPLGIMVMLEEAGVSIRGKHAVIVGRSNIVGKPIGQLLLDNDATVTFCHSKTENLRKYTLQADILIVAVGKPRFIRAEDVKEGAVVFDVGINRDENGKLCGDVDTVDVLPKVSQITPVPGGVGPMTITMLLANTIQAATMNVDEFSD
ncbi:bifunctional methylenetetrahydrofolate dehydrogenase/methenyltetrahydrofolate cyclohydrolase FolD [Fervidibacillus halotolerans]|uniref:Bifunctional protein FolD n=1 Tax=Fervidibacillus halotolerans TaxID=2980027 RepID=A0A9E8LXJ5_9BACI|nr:bifunctional methylenetetrahydrofolate dehydrogenase/methenyltetrahydrofolate cyclohydrolase FolD [Fervidibacillus halotolerans]WAA11421.1 bifunctional methylenetetrahydrofolate dehydrogenase/methenyltetrahydrofolate cyclohydrolase FolD [Fervidibacillus halotolerans]